MCFLADISRPSVNASKAVTSIFTAGDVDIIEKRVEEGKVEASEKSPHPL